MTMWQRILGNKLPWLYVRGAVFSLAKGRLLLAIHLFSRSIRRSVAMKGFYVAAAPLYLAELASALGVAGDQFSALARRVNVLVLHPEARRDIAQCISRNPSRQESARRAIVGLHEWLAAVTPSWFREMNDVLDAEWEALITEEQPMRVVSGIIEELRRDPERIGWLSGSAQKIKSIHLSDASECDLHLRYREGSRRGEPGNATLSLEIRCATLSDEPYLVPGFSPGLSRFLSKETSVHVAPSGATRLVYERADVL